MNTCRYFNVGITWNKFGKYNVVLIDRHLLLRVKVKRSPLQMSHKIWLLGFTLPSLTAGSLLVLTPTDYCSAFDLQLFIYFLPAPLVILHTWRGVMLLDLRFVYRIPVIVYKKLVEIKILLISFCFNFVAGEFYICSH